MNSTRQSCHILIKLKFSHQISEKYSNIKFHKIPSSGITESLYERTNGQMTKVISAFRNFANVPTKTGNLLSDLQYTCLHYTFFLLLYILRRP